MDYPDTTNCKWDINLKEPHELTDKEVIELKAD